MTEPYFRASVAPLKDSIPEPTNIEFEALVDSIRRRAEYYQYFAADAQRGDFCDQEYR